MFTASSAPVPHAFDVCLERRREQYERQVLALLGGYAYLCGWPDQPDPHHLGEAIATLARERAEDFHKSYHRAAANSHAPHEAQRSPRPPRSAPNNGW